MSLLLIGSVFGFGVVAGLSSVFCVTKSHLPLYIFWMLQVPLIQSQVFSYRLYAGASVNVLMAERVSFLVSWDLGSYVGISLFVDAPTVFGLNVLAVLVLVFLFTCQRPTDSTENSSG